jgi:hypothetical protein
MSEVGISAEAGLPPPADTASRIEAATSLIARLEGELAEVDAALVLARRTRGEHALAAAEGDPAARAALQAASATAAGLTVGAENIALARAAALVRLAALEAERRAEEREELRRKNVALCRERVALAESIDRLFADMAPLVEEWSALGLALYGSAADKPGVVGGGLAFLNTKFFARALPAPVAKALGQKYFAGNFALLAQADPAAMSVRHADGIAEPKVSFPFDPEQALGNPPSPAPSSAAEAPVALADADAVPDAPEVAVSPPSAASDARLAGMRLVGSLPGGGGVWEKVA